MNRENRILNSVAMGLALVLCSSLLYGSWERNSIWKDGITLWSDVIRHDPEGNARAYENRGEAYREQGLIPQAIADFNRSIMLDVASRLAHGSLGWTGDRAATVTRALDDLNGAIAAKPLDAQAYVERGNRLAELRLYDHALKDFATALSLNPGASVYLNRGYVYLELQQYDRALQDLTACIGLDPFSEDAYLNRGVVFERLGMLDRSVADYAKAIGLDPRDSLAYNNRGIAYRKMGKPDKAIEDHSKALLIDPDFAQAYADRGDCYRDMGNPLLAKKEYERACRLGNGAGCDALHAGDGR